MQNPKILFCLLCSLTFGRLWGQSIEGKVTDADGNDLVVKIQWKEQVKYSNTDGTFVLDSLDKEPTKITFSKLGFKAEERIVDIDSTQKMLIVLKAKYNDLQAVTFTGSRYKKRAAEEVVSITVMKPEFIKSAAINRLDEALNKMPGVDVVENQINIRGGSGWSYGAGSRVLLLVDDMPMLTADASDAKWDFLPIESAGQIEILKGAASAMYGSSALNGVVNFRTAFATNKPTTKTQLFGGAYMNPSRKEMVWWGNKRPFFSGGYVSHAQQFGNTDVVLGGAWYYEDSYLQGDLSRRGRVNMHIRHKLKSNPFITLGLSTNIQKGRSQTFFLHEADSTFANLLKPFGGMNDSTSTINKNRGTRFNIDPYITKTGKNGVVQSLRTRSFISENLIPEKNQSSLAVLLYANYQWQKKWSDTSGFKKNLVLISGIAGSLGDVKGELYGNRKSSNYAPYIQAEKKIGKTWFAAGARYEVNQMESDAREAKPIFRAGLNYEAGSHTFIRASWGQGYRFPTIAERFIRTSFGAASVFPNPNLQSETGRSAEIGIKQGVKLGKWLGVIDAAVFNMRYNDMIEFNFGYHYPTEPGADSTLLKNIGFKSLNIGDTRINGADISIQAAKNGKVPQNIIVGYTYILPQQIDPDSVIWSNYSTDRNFLKYRYQHSIKASWAGAYQKWSFGLVNTINSPMVNIDEVFENSKPSQNFYGILFNGSTGLSTVIRKHRDIYNTWVYLGDARVGYQIAKKHRISLVIKNLANREYYNRPALIGPPRSFTIQLFSDIQ